MKKDNFLIDARYPENARLKSHLKLLVIMSVVAIIMIAVMTWAGHTKTEYGLMQNSIQTISILETAMENGTLMTVQEDLKDLPLIQAAIENGGIKKVLIAYALCKYKNAVSIPRSLFLVYTISNILVCLRPTLCMIMVWASPKVHKYAVWKIKQDYNGGY